MERAAGAERVPNARWWSGSGWMAGGVLWLGLIVAGLGILLRYSLAPGAAGDPPQMWPAAAMVARSPGTYTLVLAVHPHCPCTRASVDELDAIMAHCRGRLIARVLFVQPDGFTEQWVKTDLWRHAASIPGVIATVDARGMAASRFGALTSGQVALYDSRGRLRFSGGITGARGHAGPNAGASAVMASVDGGRATPQTPVYGCPLEDPHSATRRQGRICTSS